MNHPKSSEMAVIAAAKVLLERGWGLPSQKIEGAVEHRFVIEVPPVLQSSEEWEKRYGNRPLLIQQQ